jgi:hypothetical protein
MTWAAIIAIIMQFVGPFLQRFLESLFAGIAPQGTPVGYSPSTGIRMVFAEARAKTWRWGLRRRLVDRLEAVALRRAPELYDAARGVAPAPVMTVAELHEISQAI